jgi:hypothetical protein
VVLLFRQLTQRPGFGHGASSGTLGDADAFQKSVQVAKANRQPYLATGREEANAASLLLSSVTGLEGLGQETTQAGG